MKALLFLLAAIFALESCSQKLTPKQKAHKKYIKEAARCCPIIIEPPRKS